jgi:lipoprotein signal peptidase
MTMKWWGRVAAFAVLIFFLDQVTKSWAPTVVLNAGSSWGVVWLPAGAMTIVHWALTLGLAWSLAKTAQPSWASGLILGGAIGNGWDRVWFGAVRDWWWVPILNVHNNLADWALTLGVGYIVLKLSLPYVISHLVSRQKLSSN